MKPCSKNRKLIAWLVLGALDARKASALRDHFAHCEGCRHYFEEISNVTEKLTAAEPDSNIQASESFHRKMVGRLRSEGSISIKETLAAYLRASLLNWRVALPATAALVIALFALVAQRQHQVVSLPAPPTVQVVSASSTSSDLAPTIANYQMIANQSLEKLDELLTRQGNKRLPPAPVYTASTLDFANTAF